MKKITILLISIALLTLSSKQVTAQYYFYDENHLNSPIVFEAGVSLGVMNCLTDLGGRKGLGKRFVKDLNLGNNQFNGSIYLSASYKEAYGLRLEGTFGQVKAYDSILKNVKSTTQGRYERNLSFKSKITEVSLIAEFYPLFIINDWDTRDDDPPRFSPYLMAGVGYFSFNPQTILNGRTVDLQPLSTEGEGFAEYPNRKPYKLQQVSIPVGIGMKYDLVPNVELRAEFLYRFLSTDYLDDASTKYVDPALFGKYYSGRQLSDVLALNDRRSKSNSEYPVNTDGGQIRANPKNNDSYFNFNIKIGYTFGRRSAN